MGTKRALTIIAMMTFTMVGFQNCSPVNFGQDASAAGKAGAPISDDTTVSDDPTDSTTVDDYVNNDDDNPTPTEVKAICADAKLKAQTEGLTPATIPSITNQHGKSFDYVAKIGTITNIFGKMVIVGAPGATIDSIQNTHGKVILCGLEIGTVENAFGKYVVSDGGVGSVTNFHGKLRLINSDVGDVENMFGKIELTNGQVTGSRTNVHGSIQYK